MYRVRPRQLPSLPLTPFQTAPEISDKTSHDGERAVSESFSCIRTAARPSAIVMRTIVPTSCFPRILPASQKRCRGWRPSMKALSLLG